MPSVSPETLVECEVPPVVENVLGMEEYAVPVEVSYLHVAFSSVVREIVVSCIKESFLNEELLKVLYSSACGVVYEGGCEECNGW